MPLTLGIDPGATLATSTWVLQRDGEPMEAGACDVLLTRLANCRFQPLPFWRLGEGPPMDIEAVVIESVQAAALASKTAKAGMRGYNTLTGVIHTEGEIYGSLRTLFPALQVIEAPRTAILQQFLGYWPYRKGLKVDLAVKDALAITHPAHLTRSAPLSTPDKRDAFLASLYRP